MLSGLYYSLSNLQNIFLLQRTFKSNCSHYYSVQLRLLKFILHTSQKVSVAFYCNSSSSQSWVAKRSLLGKRKVIQKNRFGFVQTIKSIMVRLSKHTNITTFASKLDCTVVQGVHYLWNCAKLCLFICHMIRRINTINPNPGNLQWRPNFSKLFIN